MCWCIYMHELIAPFLSIASNLALHNQLHASVKFQAKTKNGGRITHEQRLAVASSGEYTIMYTLCLLARRLALDSLPHM